MESKSSIQSAKADVTSGLHEAQIIYMKKIEKENYERVLRLKKVKKNNILTGVCLAASVLGVYMYSILAVKQEHFLDELDIKKQSGN